MRMGNSQPQRVGGIGPRQAGQFQQTHHHLLHLGLAGLAVAGNGFFHLQRGVFGHRQIGGHQCGNAGAAGLAQHQRGLRVDVDKHNLHRRCIRLVARHHFAYTVKKHLEAGRQIATRQVGGFDGAAGHINLRCALHIDHTKAGGLQARVDTKDTHLLLNK